MQAEAYNKRVINALIHSEGIPKYSIIDIKNALNTLTYDKIVNKSPNVWKIAKYELPKRECEAVTVVKTLNGNATIINYFTGKSWKMFNDEVLYWLTFPTPPESSY